jgi:hypothetical protein
MLNKLKSCFFIIVFLVVGTTGLVTSAAAEDVAANNGLGPSPTSGFVLFGPIDPEVGGPWLEFSFGTTGSAAAGCSPADPAGPICAPSSGGNSAFLDAPPWTFTTPFGGATMKVTDAFLYGDEFQVFDDGGSIGTTSPVDPDGSCGSDPEDCYPDAASSSASFDLAAGDHSITIIATDSPFGGGAAYFRVDNNGLEVYMDIKFCSDPNAFNCKKKGKTPLTIFGTDEFDVTQIDLSTLRLCTDVEGTECTDSGPQAWSMADRGDPTTDIGAEQCAIVDLEEQDYLNPDGFTDLDVAFDSQEIVELIGCQELDKNDPSPTLYLTGYLLDGTPIYSLPVNDVGVDQLMIK